jgi:predicted RNA methylase
VHTPAAIARFMLREADAALRSLGRRGIEDPDVTIVDPACGPGVFLASVLASASPGPGPRALVGFDRDPRAIEQARSILEGAARARGLALRLAALDTLESIDPLEPGERRGASLLVIGNPPWAGRSDNRGSATLEPLLDDFRAGVLGERKIGVLSDAYVRFWRWAAELARASDEGAVVALVTNASFLDGPVHRGMRAALTRWFARIDVIHLGGSALVARTSARDENVFGVRPSVAITIATRPPRHDEDGAAEVRFASLRGARDEKLARLDGGVERGAIRAAGPWIHVRDTPARYERWPSIAELFPFHREGVQTNRDPLSVDADRDRLLARLREFASGAPVGGSGDRRSEHYDPDRAREALRAALAQDPELSGGIVPIAYRPLDTRWVAILPCVCHRPRPELLAAMRASELALLSVRKDRGDRPWSHFGAARAPVDSSFLSARSSCRTRAFPTHDPSGAPNVDARALETFADRIAELPGPSELVYYALAVLASEPYRAAFDAALRADYPRVPPPPSKRAFEACRAAGERIARAFFEPESGERTATVGHHEVKSDTLRGAIAAASLIALQVV